MFSLLCCVCLFGLKIFKKILNSAYREFGTREETKILSKVAPLASQNTQKNPDQLCCTSWWGWSLAETSQFPGAGSGEFLAQLWTKMLEPGVFQLIRACRRLVLCAGLGLTFGAVCRPGADFSLAYFQRDRLPLNSAQGRDAADRNPRRSLCSAQHRSGVFEAIFSL